MKKALLIIVVAPAALLLLTSCNSFGWGDWGSDTTKPEGEDYENREPAAGAAATESRPVVKAEPERKMPFMGGVEGESAAEKRMKLKEEKNQNRAAPAPVAAAPVATRTNTDGYPIVEKGGNHGGGRECHACAAQGVTAPRKDCQVCKANAAQGGSE